MAGGQQIGVVQIAGLLARRIILEASVGDQLVLAAIWYHSLWQPCGCLVAINDYGASDPGSTMTAGETILADLSANMPEITRVLSLMTNRSPINEGLDQYLFSGCCRIC